MGEGVVVERGLGPLAVDAMGQGGVGAVFVRVVKCAVTAQLCFFCAVRCRVVVEFVTFVADFEFGGGIT